MITKYFLLIDGLKGDATDKDHKGWFDIDGFDLDVSSTGSGGATFSPLMVSMPLDGILSRLLADMAPLTPISSIKLEGVTGGADSQAVYDLTLADVLVRQVHDEDGCRERLSFDYDKIGLIAKHVPDTGGAAVPAGSFGFDLSTHTAIDPDTLPKPTPGLTPMGSAAAKYFLLIDGLKGDATDKDHKGWFDIDGFDLDVSNTGSGSATFSPLMVSMPLDGILSRLLADMAPLTPISSIKLEGVTGGADSQAVYDLTLADVLVRQVHDEDGCRERLSFDYDKIGLIAKHVPDTGGAAVPAGSFGFDLSTHTAIDPDTLPKPTPGLTPMGSAAAKYFLLIDGLKGDATDKDHKGWFDIDGFDLDVSNTGSGSATFSPLMVSMPLDGILSRLLADMAPLTPISSIKLEGVTGGADSQAVYDLTLADVLVRQVDDEDGCRERLSFDYDKIGLIAKHVPDTGGAAVPAGSFGFDLSTHTAIDPDTLPKPTPGLTPMGSAAAKYFLLIDGLKGDATDKDHKGWFDIDGFDLDVSNTGSGSATFSPLMVSMPLDGILSRLLADMAPLTPISSIKLEGVTGGADSQAVYDLTLADVLVRQVHDEDGGSDRLAFDYDKIGLITKHVPDTGGAAVPAGSFGSDLSTHTAIDPDTLPKPTPGLTPMGSAAAKYFLLIDGLKGDATDKDHKGWFDIDGFDLDVSSTGSGGATFSPLMVSMPLDGILSRLLADMAPLTPISSIKLEGVTGGADSQAVYDLTLADVLVRQVHDEDGCRERLSFDYDKIGLIAKHVPDTGGAAVPAGSFGFDLSTHTAIDPDTLPKPTPGLTPMGSAAAKYFLLIDGLKGDATDKDHKGWFDIDGFDLDVSNTGSGSATFSPLMVSMPLDGILSRLLADMAPLTPISSIKLEGVTGGADSQAVYDLTLADVLVRQVDDEDGCRERLSFDYDKIGLIAKHVPDTGGAAVPAGSFGFDLSTHTAIDPDTLPKPTPGLTPMGSAAAKYFLLIDGLKGDATDKDHKGWFDIDGFDLDVSNTGSGSATFSPLMVSMPLDGILSRLLADMAPLTPISSIKLEGVTGGADSQAVYDLTLADVLVRQVDDEDGCRERLSFDYDKIGLIAKHVPDTGGAAVPAGSFGFDLSTHTAIDPDTLPKPTPGLTPMGSAAAKYFLLIDGLKGDATDKDHKGWFDIDGFDLDVSNTGSGSATFSPLMVSMPLDGILSRLLADMAPLTPISSIKLEGVTGGADSQAVYDLTLADVLVRQVHDEDGGSDRLAFDYDKIGLITKHVPDTGGAAVPAGSFGSDLSTHTAIDPDTLPKPTPGLTPMGSAAAKYFLLIDGLKGDATDKDHKGWFDIDGFDLDVSSTGSGGATFSPLMVSMPLDGLLSRLLADMAPLTPISSIKLEGVSGGADSQAVYDLTLADVLVRQVHDEDGGSDRLAFDYDKIGLITKHVPDTGGAAVPAGSFGFDLSTHTAIDPDTLPKPTPGLTPMGSAAAKYFLLIDGLKGDATDKDHKGWFDIDGFDLDVSNTGSGSATFSPLMVSMPLDGILSRLLADMAPLTPISSIKLEGVTGGADSQAVYDLTLADVLVRQVHDEDGGSDRLAFDYDKIGLITKHVPDTGGAAVPAGSFGLDLSTHTAIDPTTLPVPGGTSDVLTAELVSTTSHGVLAF